jgi:hypothetical protein
MVVQEWRDWTRIGGRRLPGKFSGAVLHHLQQRLEIIASAHAFEHHVRAFRGRHRAVRS